MGYRSDTSESDDDTDDDDIEVNVAGGGGTSGRPSNRKVRRLPGKRVGRRRGVGGGVVKQGLAGMANNDNVNSLQQHSLPIVTSTTIVLAPPAAAVSAPDRPPPPDATVADADRDKHTTRSEVPISSGPQTSDISPLHNSSISDTMMIDTMAYNTQCSQLSCNDNLHYVSFLIQTCSLVVFIHDPFL